MVITNSNLGKDHPRKVVGGDELNCSKRDLSAITHEKSPICGTEESHKYSPGSSSMMNPHAHSSQWYILCIP